MFGFGFRDETLAGFGFCSRALPRVYGMALLMFGFGLGLWLGLHLGLGLN